MLGKQNHLDQHDEAIISESDALKIIMTEIAFSFFINILN